MQMRPVICYHKHGCARATVKSFIGERVHLIKDWTIQYGSERSKVCVCMLLTLREIIVNTAIVKECTSRERKQIFGPTSGRNEV